MASTRLVSTKARRLRHLLRVAIGQEEIGRRIREAREAADLTQRDLAERIGVQTAQSISRYERGETEVPMKRIRRIADATGKPLDFFITLPEGEQPVSPDATARLEREVAELKTMMEEAVVLMQQLRAAAPSEAPSSPAKKRASQGSRRTRSA